MIKLSLPLILASGSPRRKEILTQMGLAYTVDVSDCDESFSGAPEDMVLALSRRKAMAVAARHENALILAADTIVCLDGVILGKPESHEDALRMLSMLSGRWHSVFSGVTLMSTKTGEVWQRLCETRVHFVPLSEEERRAYAATGEPMDKAGAYALQGYGGMFVDEIAGSASNVIGLPMHIVSELLRASAPAEG